MLAEEELSNQYLLEPQHIILVSSRTAQDVYCPTMMSVGVWLLLKLTVWGEY